MNIKKYYLFQIQLITVIFFTLLAVPGFAAYLTDVPQTLTQPDGTVINCFATGDEFYNWLHDENGYTIIRDKKGYYVYAKIKNKKLVSSKAVVGIDNPVDYGLTPGINLDSQEIKKIRLDKAKKMKVEKPRISGGADSSEGLSGIDNIPRAGLINNIVIFITFADQSEYTDPLSLYDGAFNTDAISMDNYFQAASYNQLSISSTFYPTPGTTVVSYQDAHVRDYFSPYDATTNPIGYLPDPSTERRDREHQLLADAVNAVSSQIPAGLDVDGDSDGYVDNVVFIIKGPPDGWSSLLWPHRWSLYSLTVNINGTRVWDYNFQLSESFGVSVLCHEMFHSLGAPDLYHYSYDGLHPVARWDLMEWNTTPPQHMTAYMKYRYGGWISSIPEITTSGVYSLNPLSTSSTNNCYKIPSSNSSTEYFMVEYRDKTAGTFDANLYGSGLLVYRINTAQDGQGNSSGPPDEIYIYRPDGTTTVDGLYTQAHFSADVGRTVVNNSTNPSSFLTDGSAGGLDISEVSSAGATISFRVILPTQEIAVLDGTTEIMDGTLMPVSFSYTSEGQPVIKTFTIENRGSEELTLSGLSFPAGYTLIGSFPSSIAPYGSDTFQIQLDASSLGTFSGTLSFNNNDADENPFDFPITGVVATGLINENFGVSTCSLPSGWVNEVVDTDWDFRNNGTPSNYTGPSADHTGSGGCYAYIESSSPNYPSKQANLISPAVNIDTVSSPVLVFWYHMFDSGYDSMGDLHVDVFAGGSWNNDVMTVISGNQGNVWLEKVVDLSSFSGAIQVRFRGITGSSWQSDICIDDVAIYDVPPSTSSSNLIEWNGQLVADFGDAQGLYGYGSVWSQLTTWGNANQMLQWNDGSTDNLVVDFGNGRGLRTYDGATWTPLTDWDDVAGMTAWGNNLAVDFGSGRGIYNYNGGWTKITGWDTANAMVSWNNGTTDNLVVDFGSGRGIYRYDGGWNKMTSWDDTIHMTVYNNGVDDILAVDFGSGRGIYNYNGSWTKITGWDTTQDMIACGNNLAVDFGSGRGLYYYDGTWTKLTTWDTVNDMTEWNDGVTSNLVVDFGSGRGTFKYNGAWSSITDWDNTLEMEGVGTDLYVDFGPGIGVYRYDGSVWTKINTWSTGD